MNSDYKEQYAAKIASYYQDLEIRIMADIVRRIQKAGEITSTADYQINRLRILGYSSEDIEKELKKALNASYPQMFELYDKVVEKEYTRNKAIYEQINAKFIPFEKNYQLQQITKAIMLNSLEDLQNISGSLGFYLDYGNGKRVITPLAEIYQGYLDAACIDIVSGAFDYNTVLRRVVTQLTNSGLRVIDYASGWHNRVEVAARRAVMTGVSQVTGRIAEYNAAAMGTEYFEVAWHAGARPTHAVWQGKVWSEEELYSVCGMGTVTGLLGANCYHEYYPFFPGISERNWSDEWLDKKNAEENKPKAFKGKEYTLYQAKQKQRQMETAMRAQREKVQLLQKGGADRDEITLYKAKYQGQLNEYSRFCRKMKLTEERERIYLDMHGRVVPAQTAYMERGITKKRVPKQREYLIDKLAINSNEYKRKYSGITGNVKVDDNIYKYAKAGLTHRDGTNREDLYILSKTTGDILGKNISSTEEFGVRANRSIKDAIKDNLWNTIGLHTHPNNTPPTGSDFETAFKRCYNLGVVACADGSVYSYGCSDRYVSARIIDDTIEKYRKMVDSSGKKVYSNYIDAHLAALEQIRKDYGIWYEARR